MNVNLLRKVVAYAKAEPRRFNMAEWYIDAAEVVRGNENYEYINSNEAQDVFEDASDVPPCGAVGCLAGLTCIVNGDARVVASERIGDVVVTEYRAPEDGWKSRAAKALGLDEEQANSLFYPYPGFWPKPFASEYRENALDPVARVNILEKRVEHFIKTEGRE